MFAGGEASVIHCESNEMWVERYKSEEYEATEVGKSLMRIQ